MWMLPILLSLCTETFFLSDSQHSCSIPFFLTVTNNMYFAAKSAPSREWVWIRYIRFLLLYHYIPQRVSSFFPFLNWTCWWHSFLAWTGCYSLISRSLKYQIYMQSMRLFLEANSDFGDTASRVYLKSHVNVKLHWCNNKEQNPQSQLRMFIIYKEIWLQHVSARTGHRQMIQNTKKY
jgi:hypothetical protein